MSKEKETKNAEKKSSEEKENSSPLKHNQTLKIFLIAILALAVTGGIALGALYIYSSYMLKKAEIEQSKKSTQSNTNNDTQSTSDQSQVQNNQTTSTWEEYANSRFEFKINYPKTFTATESANGDGVSLTTSTPPISVNAFGRSNTTNQTTDEYLNEERANLFAGAEGAEEIEAKDAALGNCNGKQRTWKYKSPIDSSESIEIRTTCLSGSTFYTVEMVVAYSDFSEYSTMYDQIIQNFEID